MNLTGRRWTWACAALGILCALLVAATIWRESGVGSRESAEGVGSRESEVRSRESEEPVESRKLKVDSLKQGVAVASQQIQSPKPQITNHPGPIQNPKSKITNHLGPIQNPKSPITNSLKPLGYVEKAGGRVEAIVEDDGQVYIVHEGEVFADKFRVLAISRTEVQVAATLVRESGVGSRESEEPVERRELTVDSGLRTLGPHTQLGFVKRANGQVETIVADGEHVRLVRGEPVLLASIGTRVPEQEVISLEPIARKEVESRQPRVDSRESKVESPLAVAIVPPNRQPRSDGHGQTESGLPDPLQPETLAHFDRNSTRFLDSKDDLSPQTETVANQVADELGEEGSDQMAIQPPETLDTPSSGPPIPHQIGYIERVAGQAEAIVAVGDEVHFVREGEVFADRFRALSVSPTWVEIEELPFESSPPPMVALDYGTTTPGVPQSRAPTSHSPPGSASAGVGQTDVSSGPGSPRQRPPPRASPNRVVRVAARAGARAGPVDAGSEPAGERFTLKPFGFAETSDGETVAFVAVEGEVFLVRQGEAFAGRYRARRVTAWAVEVAAESPQRAVKQPDRAPDSASGKPTASTASNVEALALHAPDLSARTGIPDLEATALPGSSAKGEEKGLSDLRAPGFRLHSQAAMLDNSNNPH